MLVVPDPTALNKSAGIVSRDEQSAKVPSKDVSAPFAANRPEGTVFNEVHSAKRSFTVVILTVDEKRPAGIVSRDEQPQNVPVNWFTSVF